MKYWLVSLVAFVLLFLGAYVINAMILFEDWFTVGDILRGWEPTGDGLLTEIDLYHYMVIPYILYALGMVWLYRRGAQSRPWLAQGAIFGLMISVVTILPMRLLNYTTFKFADGGLIIPSPVLVKEMIGWVIMLVIVGVVIAWFYRKEANAKAG